MAWSALSKALPGKPKVEQRDAGNGRLGLFIDWPDGEHAHIQVDGETAYWMHLSHLKLIKGCHHAVRAVFADEGIERLRCAPADNKARKALLANGPWQDVETAYGPMLEWVLDGG